MAALQNSIRNGSTDSFHAFFGTHDHYRKSAIVSIKTWKKYFGDTFDIYEGTHFMEEDHVRTLLANTIRNILNNNK
jgi:surfactin synthase thioesterase subunit